MSSSSFAPGGSAARISILMLAAAAASVLMPVQAARQIGSAEDTLVQRARGIHDRVIAVDTHDDIDPKNFTASRNYTQRLDTQVNLPKMIEGGLDASFFIVFVAQPNEAQAPDALTDAG